MAKTRFTHSCGHDGTLVGANRSSAEYLARKRAAEPCEACQYAAAQVTAAAAARESGLPDLIGTPNQIGYAETIRYRWFTSAEVLFSTLIDSVARRRGIPAEAVQEISDAIALLRSEWRGRTSACGWIDNQPARPTSNYDLMTVIEQRGLAPVYVAWLIAREDEPAAREHVAGGESRDA